MSQKKKGLLSVYLNPVLALKSFDFKGYFLQGYFLPAKGYISFVIANSKPAFI